MHSAARSPGHMVTVSPSGTLQVRSSTVNEAGTVHWPCSGFVRQLVHCQHRSVSDTGLSVTTSGQGGFVVCCNVSTAAPKGARTQLKPSTFLINPNRARHRDTIMPCFTAAANCGGSTARSQKVGRHVCTLSYGVISRNCGSRQAPRKQSAHPSLSSQSSILVHAVAGCFRAGLGTA